MKRASGGDGHGTRSPKTPTPSWRGGEKTAGPSGPTYNWRKEDNGSPHRGKLRAKQLALFSGMLVVLAAMIILIFFLIRPPRPGFIAVGADPKEDAARLFVPLDVYGWSGGSKVLGSLRSLDAANNVSLWGKQTVAPHSDTPMTLPDDPAQLQSWADGFVKYDPIVIYFGLHGAADQKGPFLFIGNGRVETGAGGRPLEPGEPRKLHLEDLFKVFGSNKLAKRKKILVFDPGRLRPNPLYGTFQDEFADKLQGMSAQVAAVPNLLVICGTAPGQRGWESEELRCTPVAQALIETFRGEGVNTGGASNINGLAFFQAVQQKTREWSSRNRSSQQEPFLLPAGGQGEKQAEKMQVAMRLSAAQLQRAEESPVESAEGQPAPVTKQLDIKPELKAELLAKWQEHDQLAQSLISPASYAPRAWRVYRELLLRYQHAVRANDINTSLKLAADLALVRDNILAACNPMASATSTANSLALRRAVQSRPSIAKPTTPPGDDLSLPQEEEPRAQRLNQILDLLISEAATLDQNSPRFGELLSRMMTATRSLRAEQRPTEIHLPFMVNHFYGLVAGTTKSAEAQPPGSATARPIVPLLWAKVIALRRQADLAMLGLSPVDPLTERFSGAGPPGPYSERVWGINKTRLERADELRREVEDKLFQNSPADQVTLESLINEAMQIYTECSQLAADARVAWDIRDHLYADLPFLGEWAAEQPVNRVSPDEIKSLWQNLHLLSTEIDATKDNQAKWASLKAQALKLRTEYRKIRQKFEKDVEEQTDARPDQQLWDVKQNLLQLPFIPAAKRLLIIDQSRQITKLLLEQGTAAAGTATGGTSLLPDQKTIVKNRSLFAIAGLHPSVTDVDGIPDDLLGKNLVAVWEALTATPDKFSTDTRTLAQNLNKHLRRISQFTQGIPKPTGQQVQLLGELANRHGVAFEPDATWEREQAAINARLNWVNLLVGLMNRAAVDHWYDENYDPEAITLGSTTGRYFRTQAKRYEKDAETLTQQVSSVLTDPTVRPKPFRISEDLSQLLELKGLSSIPSEKVLWTSEKTRSVEYVIKTPVHPRVNGLGVMLQAKPEGELFRPAQGLQGVLASRPIGLTPEVRVKNTFRLVKTDQLNGVGTAEAMMYFRGQRPVCKVPLVLQSRPYLIMAEPLPPPDAQTYLAARAERDLPRGQIAVVLDYSKSMREPTTGGTYLDDYKTNPSSKFRVALDTLKTILAEMPDGTPITIRVFSDKASGTRISTRVYPPTGLGEVGQVNWEKNPDRLAQIMELLESLVPEYNTPILATVKKTLEEDIPPKLASGSTILFLTDGVEDEGDGKALTPAELANRRDTQMTPLFQADKIGGLVSLQVVNLGLSPEDLKLSETLFAKINNHYTPGAVWDASDRKRLAAALRNAISSKLILRDESLGRAPDGFPPSGWPSVLKPREDRPTNREDLRWSMNIPDGGELRATVSSAQSPTNYSLELSRGDHMLLLMKAGQDRRTIQLRRDLFAEFFGPERRATYKNKFWSLTIPVSFTRDDVYPPKLMTVAAVERIPNELRQPGVSRDPDETTLKHVIPEVMWWDARPYRRNTNTDTNEPQPLAPNAQTRIQREYGRFAPSWRVEVDHWERDQEGFQPAQVRAWFPESSEQPYPASLKTLTEDPQSVEIPLNNIQVQVSIEEHKLPSMPGSIPQQCLVIRSSLPSGIPVYARWSEGRTRKNSEHHYFGRNILERGGVKTDVPAAYTAYFWPINQQEANGPISFKWYSINSIIKDDYMLKLDLAKPAANPPALLDEKPSPNNDYNPRRIAKD